MAMCRFVSHWSGQGTVRVGPILASAYQQWFLEKFGQAGRRKARWNRVEWACCQSSRGLSLAQDTHKLVRLSIPGHAHTWMATPRHTKRCSRVLRPGTGKQLVWFTYSKQSHNPKHVNINCGILCVRCASGCTVANTIRSRRNSMQDNNSLVISVVCNKALRIIFLTYVLYVLTLAVVSVINVCNCK